MEFSVAPVCLNFQASTPPKPQTFSHHNWFPNLSLASSLYFVWPDQVSMMNSLRSERETSTT